jgi:acylphosphatase
VTDEADANDDRVRLDAVVVGRVQSVGFRYFVLHRAFAAGLDGWVSNEADGSVHCRAEGPRARLEELVAVMEQGPPGGRVDSVRTRWGVATGTLGPFAIRSGAHRGD